MCNRVSKKHENFTRNSSILARKQWYLRDANELFRKRDVSRRLTLSSSKSNRVSFSQQNRYSTGVIIYNCEFTQSRLQLLGFAFINGNVYGTLYIATNSVHGVKLFSREERYCRLLTIKFRTILPFIFLNLAPRGLKCRGNLFYFSFCSRILR